jgi:hypothetical protein
MDRPPAWPALSVTPVIPSGAPVFDLNFQPVADADVPADGFRVEPAPDVYSRHCRDLARHFHLGSSHRSDTGQCRDATDQPGQIATTGQDRGNGHAAACTAEYPMKVENGVS